MSCLCLFPAEVVPTSFHLENSETFDKRGPKLLHTTVWHC
uniref:Uncharacterized protein n=1 Tax=Anguilla anguilla TaxID=7936 RepID=A0A0E9QV81_ANGAN